jgi:glycosyltransferase involved in cell wall biosynthesis
MSAVNLALLGCVRERHIPIVVNLGDEWLTYQRLLDAWTRMWRRRPRLGRAVTWATGVYTAVPDLSDALHCFCSDLTRQRSSIDTVWPVKRSEITPPGVDRCDFPPQDRDTAKSRARRPFAWQLVCVGRIDERKGMSTAVRTLPLLPPQATLTFLGRGGGTYRAELEGLVEELALEARVAFGVVSRSELASRYRAADALIFPSEWEEPFGLVPLEAMACGTPVVATGVGGSAEFLRDGVNSLIFAKGDPSALARALFRLADDAELRALLVDGGLSSAEQFTAEAMADRLEYLHLSEAGPPAALNPARRQAATDEG